MTCPDVDVFDRPGALPSLPALLAECERRGIRLCHWKGNARMEMAMRGESDVDLLVHRHDRAAFCTLLSELDVKEAVARPGRNYPCVENYLGFDAETGRLFHLHVYYALMVGLQYVDEYWLPLEHEYLDEAVHACGVPVPAPPLELATLSVRALLRYRLRDAVKDLLRIRSYGISSRTLDEIRWLEGQSPPKELDETLERTVSVLPRGCIERFLELAADEERGLGLFRLRAETRKSLGVHRRMGRPTAAARYARALVQKRMSGIRRLHRRMGLRQGGTTIAFVGSDGAGKSTVLAGVHDWLAWRLTVGTFYMGTARPSLPTSVLVWTARKTAGLDRRVHGWLGAANPLARVSAWFSDHALAVGRVSEGYDRLHRYRRARRLADRGGVALFDRYPMPGIPIAGRSMDGPRIRAETCARGLLLSRLASCEQRLLEAVRPPELVVVLHVRPELALARSPDHDLSMIRSKVAAIDAMDQTGLTVEDIDANRPLHEVLESAKASVWGGL